MTASRCSFATPVPWRHRACLVPLQDVSTRFRYFLVRWSIHFIWLHRRMWFPTQDISCVIRSSRMVSMSWKALLAARHCVATPVLLSRRENRSGAIGLSIDIFISYHNRYFNIVIFNIRVSIRVRGLHLVFFNGVSLSKHLTNRPACGHPRLRHTHHVTSWELTITAWEDGLPGNLPLLCRPPPQLPISTLLGEVDWTHLASPTQVPLSYKNNSRKKWIFQSKFSSAAPYGLCRKLQWGRSTPKHCMRIALLCDLLP